MRTMSKVLRVVLRGRSATTSASLVAVTDDGRWSKKYSDGERERALRGAVTEAFILRLDVSARKP